MSNCRSIFGINVTKLKHYLFAVAFRVGVLYNISTQRERVLITRFEPPNLSPSADGEAPSRASLITPPFHSGSSLMQPRLHGTMFLIKRNTVTETIPQGGLPYER